MGIGVVSVGSVELLTVVKPDHADGTTYDQEERSREMLFARREGDKKKGYQKSLAWRFLRFIPPRSLDVSSPPLHNPRSQTRGLQCLCQGLRNVQARQGGHDAGAHLAHARTDKTRDLVQPFEPSVISTIRGVAFDSPTT
jgi:hypothetical protein